MRSARSSRSGPASSCSPSCTCSARARRPARSWRSSQGAIPNWVLNRRWAWEVTGKVEVAREVIGYAIVSLLAVAASSTRDRLDEREVQSLPAHSGIHVLLVTGSYVLVQALLFVIKFVVYDRWVFAGRSRFRAALRSRHQVWVAARANRTP